MNKYTDDLIDALCVVSGGWHNADEFSHKIYLEANDLVLNHAK